MKEKIKLYVDDLRDCPEGFKVARNMDIAIHYLENHHVEVMSLDHDLGEDPITRELLPDGQDLVKYFCANELFAEKIYIHTDNGPGRQAMFQSLEAAQRRGFISPEIEIYHYSITPNKYTLTKEGAEDMSSLTKTVPFSYLTYYHNEAVQNPFYSTPEKIKKQQEIIERVKDTVQDDEVIITNEELSYFALNK